MSSRQRPYVVLKAALSIDGFLDDENTSRRVFSGPEDRAEVDALRASCDAILVGAETLRADNARLCIISEDLRVKRRAEGRSEHPRRVCVTKSAELSEELRFFDASPGESPIVFCPPSRETELQQRFDAKAEIVSLPEDPELMPRSLIEKLQERGVQRLLVEGGAGIFRAFLKAGVADEIRLAYAAISLGDCGGVRLDADREHLRGFELSKVEQIGEMSVLRLLSQSAS